MEKEFIPYELAVKLKKLGFNEPCMAVYFGNGLNELFTFNPSITKENTERMVALGHIPCPIFSQVFRWFREKYNTHVEIHETTDWEEDNESWSFVIFKYRLGDNDGMISSTIDYKTYEEAELDCLIKLIEIVENEKTL